MRSRTQNVNYGRSRPRKIIAVFLSVIMMLSVIPIAVVNVDAKKITFTYNPDAAIQFAKQHCEIDAKRFPNAKCRCTESGVAGEWLCAEFVYKCLVAGGYKKTTKYNEKVPYTLGLELLANGAERINCKKRVDQAVYMSDFDSKLSKGDVIIILYTNKPSGSSGQGHAVIYSGTTDKQGRVKVYAHNKRKQNEVLWTSPKTCSIYALHLSGESPTYTITAKPVTQSKTTNTSTEFNVGISPKGTVYKVGVFYGTNQSAIESINVNTEHKDVAGKYEYRLLTDDPDGVKRDGFKFDTAKQTTHAGEKIKFEQSKKPIYYKFVVKTKKSPAQWAISGTNQFTLGKDVPASVTNLNISGEKQIGTGKQTTITWTKSKLATEYYLKVTRSNGSEVYHETKGKDCTSCQTHPIDTPDTYTVHLIAKNIHGSSSEAKTDFEVMPNVSAYFDSGFGTPEKKTVPYGDNVTVPQAPNREGYNFDGWKNADVNTIIQPNAKINNLKSDVYYNAVWTPKNYTINIIDGITNDTISSTSQPFDSDFKIADFIQDDIIPTHTNYQFVGFSEDSYIVKAETHNIYVRYMWDSDYHMVAEIPDGGIKRAQSVSSGNSSNTNDGYSIDVNITAPSISAGGTSETIKGRVVVALKTDAGRLLIETESAAFVIYPNNTEPVTKAINVFVPYEADNDTSLPTVIEAYVVNNYYTAGIVSNIATNNAELLRANAEEDYLFSSTPVSLGQEIDGKRVVEVAPDRDYFTYTLTTTTAKDTFDSSMDGYTLDTNNTRWSDTLWNDYVRYVKEWPSLVSNGGDRFDNTQGAGKEFYNRYNNTPYEASENDSMRVDVIEQPCDYIFYHWCNGRNNGNIEHNVTGKKATDANGNWKYIHFHCHSLTPEQCVENGVVSKYVGGSLNKYAYEYNTSNMSSQWYRDKCTDSKYWVGSITVWLQGFYTHKKIYNFTKSEVQDNIRVSSENEIIYEANHVIDERVETFPVNNVTLYTTQTKTPSNITHWYAYRLENNTITHEDKNIIDISGVTVGGVNEEKDATLYLYKSTQVSDFTTEYIGNVKIDTSGRIINPDTNEQITTVQTREAISNETGDFTVAVAVKGETNAIIIGTISAPKPESYIVTFVNDTGNTDENGNIVYNVISEQHVAPGGSAVLPDEADIPVKEGYHFVCWNLSTDIVNGDMTVQAIYDKNEYAVVFVDWEARSIDIQKYPYQANISVTPSLPAVDEDSTVEWIIGDGSEDNAITLAEWKASGGTVTSDMIISAKYSLKKVNLTVVDFATDSFAERSVARIETVDDPDSVISEFNTTNQGLEYGDIIQLENYEQAYDDCIIIGWKNIATKQYLNTIEIREDMTIYPVLEYEDTVFPPEADVVTGEFTSAQTITLTCETEGATIFYTTDRSDPVSSDTAIAYTEPIALNETATLMFYAYAPGKNSSGVMTEMYAINTVETTDVYHLLTVYADLPQQEGEYYQALVLDSSKVDDTMFRNVEGYTYNGLFYDTEYTERFRVKSETIIEETTLYASYTPLQFTATFEDFDGTVLATSTVDYGEVAEAPTPTREGFVFIGWDSQDYEYLTADKTFTAQYCPEDEYTPLGDVNLDHRVNIRDVTAIQRHIAELELLSEEQIALADTNGDGKVDIADATHLQMYLAEYDVVLGKQPTA